MGQGLHTKVAQVAASAFDIPLNSVYISETSTDKVLEELFFINFHAGLIVLVSLQYCT